jgi:hypothetical protein
MRKLAENLDSLETKVSSYRQNILPQLMVGICTDNIFELLEKFLAIVATYMPPA